MNLLILSGLKKKEQNGSTPQKWIDGYNEALSELEALRPDVKELWKTISKAEGAYWKLEYEERRKISKEEFMSEYIINSMPQWIKERRGGSMKCVGCDREMPVKHIHKQIKKRLSQELCEIMEWPQERAWSIQNASMKSDYLDELVSKLKQLKGIPPSSLFKPEQAGESMVRG